MYQILKPLFRRKNLPPICLALILLFAFVKKDFQRDDGNSFIIQSKSVNGQDVKVVLQNST